MPNPDLAHETMLECAVLECARLAAECSIDGDFSTIVNLVAERFGVHPGALNDLWAWYCYDVE